MAGQNKREEGTPHGTRSPSGENEHTGLSDAKNNFSGGAFTRDLGSASMRAPAFEEASARL